MAKSPWIYPRVSSSSGAGEAPGKVRKAASREGAAFFVDRGPGDFSDMPSSSPFIKSGTIPSDGTVPVEFIGKWYATSNTGCNAFVLPNETEVLFGALPWRAWTCWWTPNGSG
ncbi:MAG: hypothetical protein LBT14_09870 [Treponema sp.]|jgi:hypothetical protein|nr:hypothetical protein [Treponema sp.]